MTSSRRRPPATDRAGERDILAEVEAIVQAADLRSQGEPVDALRELAAACRQVMDQYRVIGRQITETTRFLKGLAATADADMTPTVQTGLLSIQLLAFVASHEMMRHQLEGLLPALTRLDTAWHEWQASITRDGGRDA